MYKVTVHLSNGDEIVVDDVSAESQKDAWLEVCQDVGESYLIQIAAKQTIHRVAKRHIVDIETKDKNAASLKNKETAMTAIDALSNMGL